MEELFIYLAWAIMNWKTLSQNPKPFSDQPSHLIAFMQSLSQMGALNKSFKTLNLLPLLKAVKHRRAIFFQHSTQQMWRNIVSATGDCLNT